MLHQSRYNTVHASPETCNQKSKTQKTGYIPAKQRVENLMLAGQRLKEYRNEQYDWPDGNIDENYIDPTRRKGYDLADASQDAFYNQANLKAARDRQIAIEADKKASEDLKKDPEHTK